MTGSTRAPLTFANAPRVERNGGVFIEEAAADVLISELIEEHRPLLDRLKVQ